VTTSRAILKTEIFKLSKWNLHVFDPTFLELQQESAIEAIGAQKRGVPKGSHWLLENMNQVQLVSGNDDFTDKMATFANLYWNVAGNLEKLLQRPRSWQYFCKTILIKVIMLPFLDSSFFQQSTWCHAVAAKTLFSRPKLERKFWFGENCDDGS